MGPLSTFIFHINVKMAIIIWVPYKSYIGIINQWSQELKWLFVSLKLTYESHNYGNRCIHLANIYLRNTSLVIHTFFL